MTREETREEIAKPICKLCGQSDELECNISEGGCVELAECLDTITSNLHSQGVVIKVDRELPEPVDSCVCSVCEFIRINGTIPQHSLIKAGLAVTPLVEGKDAK